MLAIRRSALRTALPAVRPNAARVAGIAAALCVHAAVLGVLLLPIVLPAPDGLPRIVDEPLWVEARPAPLIRPLPPVPEAPTIPRPRPRIEPPPVRVPMPERTDAPPAMLATADVPSLAETPAVTDPAPTAGTPGRDDGQLAYRHAPPPPYPALAARRGIEGTVWLRVRVSTDGRAIEVRIQRSSGERTLDEAARRHVLRHWRFRPASRDGRAVEAVGVVPVAFRLHGG